MTTRRQPAGTGGEPRRAPKGRAGTAASAGVPVTLHDLGLPSHSPLTIEGRIELSGMMATHMLRSAAGAERPLWSSEFAPGLLLIMLGFAGFLLVLVLLYVLGLS